jgi:plastocyanin
MTRLIAYWLSCLALAALPLAAMAQDAEFTIVIKDHRFQPAELTVPAGKKVKLTIDNQDATPEEFESKRLRVEKVIAGKSKGTVTIGPLKAGSYSFVGEYNESTAKGVLHAK